ncbi:MAG: hypothetical protein IPK61_03875 [Saprospiraceae bacterium]|nr:hypothetical protein [Saprospiraceae bacterium]
MSQIEIGYSQCNIPGNSNPVEAFIFCDLDMLNQLKCTTNPNEDNAGLLFFALKVERLRTHGGGGLSHTKII